MNLLRNHGLELPLIDADVPLLHTKDQMRAVAQTDATSFVRSVELDGLAWTYDLKSHLRRADKEFERVQDQTGSPVVNYTWARYPREAAPEAAQKAANDYRTGDFVLAAIVDVIRPVAEPDSEALAEARRHNLSSLIRNNYYRDRNVHLVPRLYDIGAEEYVHGVPATPDNTHDEPTFWLVDIEPRLSRVVLLSPTYI